METIVEEYLRRSITEDRFFVVGLKVLKQKTGFKIVAEVDSDTGITIDECGDIARTFNDLVEAEDGIKDHYVLEVASPGADKPLKFARQFFKNVGRTLRVVTNDGVEYLGLLKEVSDTGILLAVSVKEKGKKAELLETPLLMSDLKKATVEITF